MFDAWKWKSLHCLTEFSLYLYVLYEGVVVKRLNGGEVSIHNLNGNLLILSILWNTKDVYGNQYTTY